MNLRSNAKKKFLVGGGILQSSRQTVTAPALTLLARHHRGSLVAGTLATLPGRAVRVGVGGLSPGGQSRVWASHTPTMYIVAACPRRFPSSCDNLPLSRSKLFLVPLPSVVLPPPLPSSLSSLLLPLLLAPPPAVCPLGRRSRRGTNSIIFDVVLSTQIRSLVSFFRSIRLTQSVPARTKLSQY